MSEQGASAANHEHVTPFVELSRSDWAALAPTTHLPLSEKELVQLRGLGEPLNREEVTDVYLPVSRLLNLYAAGARQLHRQTSDFLGERAQRTPFVIGVAGSVAVGKSTIALLRFVSAVKSGATEVRAPFYSHLSYDIVPDAQIVVRQPDVLIVEGLNVLQPPGQGHGLAVSDLFDFTVYVDARTRDIARWYEERFLKLQRGAFSNPKSYFHRYSTLSEEQARAKAQDIWGRINEPNLLHNIRPTRSRATLVLRKDSDHAVSKVLLRKV